MTADGDVAQRPFGGVFDMHKRPSSRKRVNAVQRLRLYWIA
jgi:hypothetical protein